jgi:desulfoferrodoxin (superoxide reductase-like protein)
MFYEVKAFVSKTSVIIGHVITDQNEIQWIVLAREPVKINREQWYIYQVMATST